MDTESQAISRAIKASEREFLNEVVVVYRKSNGDYWYTLESEYIGEEDNICGKYLNGKLTPV